MDASRLNRRILIQKEVTTKNAMGTPVEAYSDLKTTYATVTYTSGTGADEYGEQSYTDAIFSIRYDARVNYKCRIIFEGSIYKILSIENIGRKDGMRLKTIMYDNE